MILVVDVDEDDDAVIIDRYDDSGKKLGAKKMAKLQEKEEKRRMREVSKWHPFCVQVESVLVMTPTPTGGSPPNNNSWYKVTFTVKYCGVLPTTCTACLGGDSVKCPI